jgi:hypothetical protein
MILLGVKAKKLPEYEEIRTINGCQLADASPRRYRNLIRRRLFPERFEASRSSRYPARRPTKEWSSFRSLAKRLARSLSSYTAPS